MTIQSQMTSRPRATGAVQPVISVIVPTYNEASNLAPLVERLEHALSGIAWEVVFVDDNSPDQTHRLAKLIAAGNSHVRCLRRVGRRGLAGACIDGILSSSAPYVAVMDGDLQHDETVLKRMLHRLEDGEADIVVGTRYSPGGSAAIFSLNRSRISRFATTLTKSLLGVRLSDPMSGFFAMRREAFETVARDLSPDGFKILLDVVASANGALRIAEEPFVFAARSHGESKFSLRTALEFLGLIAAKLTGNAVEPRFALYAFVGTLGLLVHLIIQRTVLLGAGFSFEQSQIAATSGAMLANFFLNNLLTYKDLRLSGLRLVHGAIIFCGIGATGFIANIGVASWLYGGQPIWWLAGLSGALVGAVWNYAMSNRFVWRLR